MGRGEARVSDPQISEVHQSKGGWLPQGRPRRACPSSQGAAGSRVFGSSLSRGSVCRASPWLWRLRETQVQMKATCSPSPWLTNKSSQAHREARSEARRDAH